MEERNLDLAARNEDTRDKFHTEVIRFELDQILQHFTETIQAINAQFDVADGAFYQRGGTENTKDKLKRRLNELFSRRNIIAHQSDRAHTDAQVKNITKEIVQNFIYDVQKIVSSIDAVAKNK